MSLIWFKKRYKKSFWFLTIKKIFLENHSRMTDRLWNRAGKYEAEWRCSTEGACSGILITATKSKGLILNQSIFPHSNCFPSFFFNLHHHSSSFWDFRHRCISVYLFGRPTPFSLSLSSLSKSIMYYSSSLIRIDSTFQEIYTPLVSDSLNFYFRLIYLYVF